ncbi:hypothetical protein KSP40_PGU009864 [Platanthera guangdongensis]|uniref:Uncharacterized protein n=1 Tax=Platanthera guangdongensis TaxID=2320717 RepID=A0ABR2MQ10_9ASPA
MQKVNPLLQWDPKANRVSISSVLPDWAERDTVTDEAFALGFGLYNRKDARAFDQQLTRHLAYGTARVQMQALVLADKTAHRDITLERNLFDAIKSREVVVAETATLKAELAASQQLLAMRSTIEDSAQAQVLRAKVANLECKNKLLKTELKVAQGVKVSVPPSLHERLKSLYFSEYDIEVMMQENA